MKSFILRIVIPLTIVSFGTITKWWYTLSVDAPDTTFIGFPLPFVLRRLSYLVVIAIFVTEFIADLLTYFHFCFIVTILLANSKISRQKIAPPGSSHKCGSRCDALLVIMEVLRPNTPVL
jgi:hypothetical protein